MGGEGRGGRFVVHTAATQHFDYNSQRNVVWCGVVWGQPPRSLGRQPEQEATDEATGQHHVPLHKLCRLRENRETCSGYLFQRVGKIAATAVGGGFLLLQIANHSGYVQVDWKKVEKDVNKAKKHLKKKANKAAPEINSFIEESTEFVKRNVVLSSGFIGGFLLGLAS
ncbi:hypothetical protein AAFF_G00026990 [Aldrovandia affinis]|uniref:FUN14 domain-containing protein 1 n=1 Tax=Aldrovandia affinis TaxID=143900 RepID=A0AAD7R2J6_9TELE|nr:hypothetical protein AAFF_G00026990 [Aldrovandia affinis]